MAHIQISLPEKVKMIIQTLSLAGHEAYAVGGCVRDAILGRTPADWDITTSASPCEVKRLFPRTIDTGIQHGTVTVMLGREGFEVTTYRVDGRYEDCRHPKEVHFTKSLLEDLKRRDFTINAMAYKEEGGLVDEFGGLADLERGIIRCVGNAKDRFREDALRMLRAVRFGAQLGFALEPDTEAAIRGLGGNLRKVSAERIQAELIKLLMSSHPEKLLEAWDTGLTKVFLPEFDVCMECGQNNPHHCYSVGMHTVRALQMAKRGRIVRLAVLLHDIGKPRVKTTDECGIDHFHGHCAVGSEMAGEILRRLKFDNETVNQVKKLVHYHDYRPPRTPAGVRRAANRIGAELFPLYLEVQRADILAQSQAAQPQKLENLAEVEAMYGRILEERECFSLKNLAVTGRDLMEIGIPQGPGVGEALRHLLELVIEEPERNQRGWLMAEAARFWDICEKQHL